MSDNCLAHGVFELCSGCIAEAIAALPPTADLLDPLRATAMRATDPDDQEKKQ